MVFNSIIFLIFCCIVYPLYYAASFRLQNLILLAASYVFYSFWDWRFTGLLLLTTVVDYILALKIDECDSPKMRKLLLVCSIALNLTVLGFFKYFNFFSHSFQLLLNQFGISCDWPTLNIVLPVGISFYTFLSMSYTIDVFRRNIRATRNLTDFALFVSFFPHLVAGPIVRASYLLPQCSHPRIVLPREVLNGIWLIVIGLVKKVVIADTLASIVNAGFVSQTPPVQDANAWWIVFAFAFQIYGDFSGYSDIARGLAKTMGFELVENFRAPYLVTNAREFWKHWHISLSTWLRDYLYIPLGGNRGGRLKSIRNLFLTMLLGGLWHGAGVAYLLWGGYHGLLLCVQHVLNGFSKKSAESSGLGRACRVSLFFILTCVGWLIFRAGACPQEIRQDLVVWNFLKAMTTPTLHLLPAAQPVLVLGLFSFLLQWRYKEINEFADWRLPWQIAGMSASLALICAAGVFEGSQFIYFQF